MCAVDGTPRLLVCPDTCDSEDTPFEECTCEVSALLNGKTTWQNLFPCVLSTTENQNDFLAIMPEELVTDMMTMLATSSVIEGDMIESSSPQDPLFWMIHTVIERMLAAKRLPSVLKMGTKDIYKWEYMGGASEHWVAYSYYDLGLNETPMHREPYTCVGHAAEDEVSVILVNADLLIHPLTYPVNTICHPILLIYLAPTHSQHTFLFSINRFYLPPCKSLPTPSYRLLTSTAMV